MKKFGIILAMTAAVIIVYLIITVMQPVTNDIVATANSSANWTGFESTQSVINAFPIYVWVVPGAIYLIALTIYLKFGET